MRCDNDNCDNCGAGYLCSNESSALGYELGSYMLDILLIFFLAEALLVTNSSFATFTWTNGIA